jgi:DNA-binding Lrp family transcriptional regulator
MTYAVTQARTLPEWASLAELAGHFGVSPPAIKKRVERLERLGMLETQQVGKRKLVNVSQYLAGAEATFDAVRAASGSLGDAGGSDEDGSPVLAKEQARKVKLQADLAQLQLDKALGVMVEISAVEDAMALAAGAIVRVLEAVPGRADFAAAVARDGEQGARRVLKEMVREVRERLAASMTLMVGGSDKADDDMIRYAEADAAETAESHVSTPEKLRLKVPKAPKRWGFLGRMDRNLGSRSG